MTTHYDPFRRCYIQFKSDKHRDKFLAKLAEAEQARMKHLAEVKTMFNTKVV